jgi:hypothetical protein
MSLKAFVEAALEFLEAIGLVAEVIEELREEKRSGGNPPPEVSVHDEMMRRWPTRQEARQRPVWPPFEGHRKPLGGGR